MKNRLAALLCVCLATPASASVWMFEQASSGFTASAVIGIAGNGALADLPTRSYTDCSPRAVCAPPDFAPLTSLDITAGSHYTLNDFVYPVNLPAWPFPAWHVAPYGIDFIDTFDHKDFFISFTAGTIRIDGDDGPCMRAGACIATGAFVDLSHSVPVPEPTVVGLLLLSLLATFGVHRGYRPWRS